MVKCKKNIIQASTPISAKPVSLTSPRSLPVLEAAGSAGSSASGGGSRLVPLNDTANPLTVLTPPGGGNGKRRVPSGEGGYVIMSPGVTPLNRYNKKILLGATSK